METQLLVIIPLELLFKHTMSSSLSSSSWISAVRPRTGRNLKLCPSTRCSMAVPQLEPERTKGCEQLELKRSLDHPGFTRAMTIDLLNSRSDRIDEAIRAALVPPKSWLAELYEAMEYACIGGTRHFLGFLATQACDMVGGDMELATQMACAYEMWIAMTNVQDDLPCLDDANLRRGKLAVHVKYGECTANLACTTLIGVALEHFLSALHSVPAEVRAQICFEYAQANTRASLGQFLDSQAVEGREQSLELLEYINMQKSSTVFEFALVSGALVGGATQEQVEHLRRFGYYFGLIFQVCDDLLDAVDANGGKEPGIDEKNGKVNHLTVLGQEKCEQLVAELTRKAEAELSTFDPAKARVLLHLLEMSKTHGVLFTLPEC